MGDNIEFDGKKRRIILHGNCDDLRPLCEAACCRHDWIVEISEAEHNSGYYASQSQCSLTRNMCDKDIASCKYRFYDLKKRPDGACIHLNEDNRCSIYPNRPKVCRENSCQGGWQLGTFSPIQDRFLEVGEELDEGNFVKSLSDDKIFVLHPLVKLHTIFIVKNKGEVVFLKEMVSRCGKFYTQDKFPFPQFDDNVLLSLIQLFGNKDTLQEVHQHFCKSNTFTLTKREFYSIVWLLNKHNIILDVINFRGMLSGIGGL